MNDWDVSEQFMKVVSIKMCLIGLFFVYLYSRKKVKTFLFLSMSFFSSFILIFFDLGMPYFYKLIIVVVFLMASLVGGFNEVNRLERSGKTTSEILRLDKTDSVVFALFVFGWIMLRIFLQHR